ncbi:MAG: DegT/DnrJ/EryC1/StrS family aminotransferase, partial [Nitrobacter sp.]
YGRMVDMEAVMGFAGEHDLLVVEDAAQAHGARRTGRSAGTVGHAGCFSFYPGKNLGAYGEGGAVVTNSAEYAKRISLLRDWGQESKYNHVLRGYNYRMDGIQGAILNVKMNYIEAWTEGRRAAASLYDRLLQKLPCQRPASPANRRHVYHVYAVTLAQRDEAQAALQAAGIGVGIHYPVPVHLQKAYADVGHGVGSLPVTEALSKHFLSLPIYAELKPEQVDAVAAELEKALLAVAA